MKRKYAPFVTKDGNQKNGAKNLHTLIDNAYQQMEPIIAPKFDF